MEADMTQEGFGDGEAELGETMQSLIVSQIRFSTGLALYGIGQLQKIFDAAIGDRGLPAAAERLESALDELSQSLQSDMDETRKEALRSVSRVSAKAVEKAFEVFSPAAIGEAGKRLLGRRDETRTGGATAPATASASLAVDVLSGPPRD
jgi:hypothetical protein